MVAPPMRSGARKAHTGHASAASWAMIARLISVIRYRRYQVADPATSVGYKPYLPSWRWGVEETAMRKVLVALV